jgi:lipopolysaccharide export system ATP-binding protein
MKKSILEVKNLVKTYQGRSVVNNLSFEVKQGEIFGLLGPNGAGKTTAFYMTAGLIKPDKGQVFFNGIEVTAWPMYKRAKLGLGYLAQEPSVFRNLSVEENLIIVLQTLNLNKGDQKSRLDELLQELNLEKLAKKPAGALSGGERRRLEITRALITKPLCLLLDEPFANIDPISIKDVQMLTHELAAKGISILITDHNAREIFSIATRSSLVQDGRVLLTGTKEELINSELARKYYLGYDFKL